MNIQSVRFTQPENNQVEITFNDLTTYTQPYNEARYRYSEMLDEWLAVPNTITPYDPYYGVSDEQLRREAYDANVDYAQDVMFVVESNPVSGTHLDERGTAKENERRNNRAKGKDKLTDADDEMADYIDSCMDALDEADQAVENLDRQGLIDWDTTAWSYPVWNPPIV